MKVVFRADSSVDIGVGHVMRCLTLAAELRKLGCQCLFLCRQLQGDATDLVWRAGYGLRLLSGACSTIDWRQDADECLRCLQDGWEEPNWLVVDHYGLDERWESVMHTRAHRIMVIDDTADRPHDCDLILDQNLYPDGSKRYGHLVPVGAKQLIGPGYALLRPEFAAMRHRITPRSGKVGQILVSFGGTDPANATMLALDALRALDVNDFVAHVVVGENAPFGEILAATCAELAWARFYRPAKNMAELMACTDLAMGAAGSTVWERCALGLPAVMISLAANQEPIAKALDQIGAARYLGPVEALTAAGVGSGLESMLQAPQNLHEMSQTAWRLVDGKGTPRVVDEMKKLS